LTGAAIRFARENRGRRLADLAAQVGHSVSTISRLETSRREPTDLAQIRRIADAVAIPSYVLGELLGVPTFARATVDKSGDLQDEEDDVRRRELFAAGLVVPAVLLAGVDDALAMMPEPSSPASLAVVSSRLARLRGNYDAGNLAHVI
jgi:transcriptional regulator with XRE-family HTH domain